MKKSQSGLRLRFDRILSHDLLKQVAILFGVLVLLFCLSFVLLSLSDCDWTRFCSSNNINKWLLPLYLLIDGNSLNSLYMGDVHGWMLFASIIIYMLGIVVFNGMIISVLTNTMDRRVQEHRDGMIHYLKSGHYVIMGYDEIVSSIIESILEKDSKAYVLLLTSSSVGMIRERLQKVLTGEHLKRVIINYGHRLSPESFKDIHLEAAEEIFVVGNRTLQAHDAANIECLDSICDYLQKHKKVTKELPNRITCVFENIDTYAAFMTTEIFGRVNELGIEFVPYNFYTSWAKQVLVIRQYKSAKGKYLNYPSLYQGLMNGAEKQYVHLVFVGTSTLAVAFAMEAAHVLHFPNYKDGRMRKTRITFIDINADKEMLIFITRNRHFFDIQSCVYRDSKTGQVESIIGDSETSQNDFLDIDFEFVKGDIFSKDIQRELRSWATDNNQCLSVFLTMSDQNMNFAIGMNMPDEIYENQIPVFIRQDRSGNFVTNLRLADDKIKVKYFVDNENKLVEKECKGRYANIYPIGMTNGAISDDSNVLKRAKLINYLYSTADYATYKFTDFSVLDKIPNEKIWQEAEDYWNGLSVAVKWSNIYCAYNIPCRVDMLRSLRQLSLDDASRDMEILTDEEAEVMGVVEHNRWNVEKLLMGYRKSYAYEDKYRHKDYACQLSKNKKLFVHHDIRPYEELDIIKYLDVEIARYVPWILKMTK